MQLAYMINPSLTHNIAVVCWVDFGTAGCAVQLCNRVPMLSSSVVVLPQVELPLIKNLMLPCHQILHYPGCDRLECCQFDLQIMLGGNMSATAMCIPL